VSIVPNRISLVPADVPVRLVARGIDTLILIAVTVTLGMRIGFRYDWLLISATIVILYFALSDAFAGATLGKRALALQVLGPDESRPTVKQSLTREAFTLLGAIPYAGPLLAAVAWVWITVTIRANPLRQGKHDLLAGGTRVVRRIST
jgi:uncharacterized RDD family membrane protein YckC